MSTYKITLGFIGSAYSGWQSQTKGDSIQEIFENILERLFKVKTNLISSSRTDAGVHAKAMAAHFKADTSLSPEKIKDALNFYLPKDIAVFEIKKVRDDFHARYHAKSKIYEYTIWNSAQKPLFERDQVLWLPQPLDEKIMHRAAQCLVGEHDFRSFCDRMEVNEDTRKRIDAISVIRKKHLVILRVRGNGFLRHMVRVIVGTLIEVGRGKLRVLQMKQILLSEDRKKAGPTAKAMGLCLVKVNY